MFYNLNATLRPIDKWGEKIKSKYELYPSPFKVSLAETLDLLQKELDYLKGKNVVVMLDFEESELRRDGSLRTGAQFKSARVILAFDSKHGPLKYPCDNYIDWQSNIRAIALSLNALRSVDRWGVTRRAEQYTGWKALPAGRTDQAMTIDQAAEYINAKSTGNGSTEDSQAMFKDRQLFETVYRMAAKRLHPDTGGNHEDFTRLQEARRVLDQHFGGKM